MCIRDRYITIPKNNGKIKTNWDKKLTTTHTIPEEVSVTDETRRKLTEKLTTTRSLPLCCSLTFVRNLKKITYYTSTATFNSASVSSLSFPLSLHDRQGDYGWNAKIEINLVPESVSHCSYDKWCKLQQIYISAVFSLDQLHNNGRYVLKQGRVSG